MRAVVRILQGKGARASSIGIAESLIKKSLKYQFTEINLGLAKLLRRHYRIYRKNKSKAKKYDTIVKEQFQLLIAEKELDSMYEQLVFELRDKRSVQNELVKKGKISVNNAMGIYSRFESSKIGQLSHLLFVLEYNY